MGVEYSPHLPSRRELPQPGGVLCVRQRPQRVSVPAGRMLNLRSCVCVCVWLGLGLVACGFVMPLLSGRTHLGFLSLHCDAGVHVCVSSLTYVGLAPLGF
jgi:hypothetical protein